MKFSLLEHPLDELPHERKSFGAPLYVRGVGAMGQHDRLARAAGLSRDGPDLLRRAVLVVRTL